MATVHEGEGLRFLYPENWHLEEARNSEGWSVTLQSPETAFLLFNVLDNRPSVKEVLASTLAAMREEYPELEATEVSEPIAHHRASGYDIQFFSLDLLNSCWVRCFRTPRHTILILAQATDAELKTAEPVLRAIRRSLEMKET
jgi:hypothetical protein